MTPSPWVAESLPDNPPFALLCDVNVDVEILVENSTPAAGAQGTQEMGAVPPQQPPAYQQPVIAPVIAQPVIAQPVVAGDQV